MRYVSCKLDDNSPFSGLLWQEVRRIEHEANMTNWQRVVWEWTLLDLSTRDIAEVLCVSHQNIVQHLQAAQEKALSVPGRGMLTHLIETCGARLVHELLMENLDHVTPRHPWAKKLTRKAFEKKQKREEDQIKQQIAELKKLNNTCRK
jgi:DNA-binding CsgD family transcriptional regulator